MSRLIYAVAGVLVAGAIFQLFLRYDYIHTSGLVVLRVDRVSGASCYMPCRPPTPIPPTPKPTPYDFNAAFETANENAIALVKALPSIYVTIAQARPNSKWRASSADPDEVASIDAPGPAVTLPPGLTPLVEHRRAVPDPVRVVSYSDPKGFGFYWEAHLDTRQVYFINDDAALSAKYGIK